MCVYYLLPNLMNVKNYIHFASKKVEFPLSLERRRRFKYLCYVF